MFSNWLERLKSMSDEAIKYMIAYDIIKLIIKVIIIKFFLNKF